MDHTDKRLIELHDKAQARVNATPELQPYQDILIDYHDWTDLPGHYEWVATEDVARILDYCETLRGVEEPEPDPMTIINLHIPVSLLRQVERRAGPQKRAAWIREAIEQRLKTESPE
jgi:hypothetical protein